MNIKLMESLKKIANDKETLKQIENSDCSLRDIYDICKEHGFTDSYEVFEKDYEELFAYLINEIKEEELSSVSGGKMNRFFSKSTAALLSALTLSTTAIPMSSAADYNNSSSTNKVFNFVKKNPGKSLALLATTIAVPAGIAALGFAGYKLFSKDEKTTSTNNETFNEKTTPTSNKTFNKKVIIDREYINRKIKNYSYARELVINKIDENARPNIVNYVDKGISNSNEKNNMVNVLLSEIELLKDNNFAGDIIDYIIIINIDHINSGATYKAKSNALNDEISYYNNLTNSEVIEKELNIKTGKLTDDDKIVLKELEANEYDIDKTKKSLVSKGTMTQEKVDNCLRYSLDKIYNINALKEILKKPQSKTRLISLFKDALNKLPTYDMLNTLKYCMIFFSVLKNNVKSFKKRMEICDTFENKLREITISSNNCMALGKHLKSNLKTATVSSSNDDLINIIKDTFKENEIELEFTN